MVAHSSNADWLNRAERVVAGAIGGYRPPKRVEFVIDRGQGSRVWDPDGREYLDFLLSSGPLILGHAHPAVVEAVRRQLERGTSFYMANPPAIALAEEIVRAAGGTGQVKFVTTGSEATLLALRLARAHTGRNKLLKFEGAYHGSHDAAQFSVSPRRPSDYPSPLPESAGVPRGVQRDVLVAPFNDLASVTRIVSEHASDLAAIIVDAQPIGIDPLRGFLDGLRSLCRQYGALLIFDEVVTGFRLAYGGAREHYGTQPDLIAYGKIIGGGFPLAAVWGPEEIMAAVNPPSGRSRVQMLGTFSGNPIAASAGLATLGVLQEPGAYERLRAVGHRLREGLRAACAEAGVPVQVLGDGPNAAVCLMDGKVTDYRDQLASDIRRRTAINVEMIRQGILIRLAGRFFLSLVHTDADVDQCVGAFEAGLNATAGPR